MQHKRALLWIVGICCGTLVGCRGPSGPNVQFGEHRATSHWGSTTLPGEAPADSADEQPTDTGPATVPGSSAGANAPALGGAGSSRAMMPASANAASSGGSSAAAAASAAAGSPAGAAGVGGAGSAAGSSGRAASDMPVGKPMPLQFEVTTLEQHHRLEPGDPGYDKVTNEPNRGPSSVGAIWIQNARGEVVRTLELWCSTWCYNLTTYKAALGIPNSRVALDIKRKAGVPDIVPDAISRATKDYRNPKVHKVSWDMTDGYYDSPVLPGTYKLYVEVADCEDGPTAVQVVSFEVPAAGPQTITEPLAMYYSDMSLKLQ